MNTNHSKATGTSCIITLTPKSTEAVIVDQISWSYETTVAGKLTVSVDSAEPFDQHITVSGHDFVYFPGDGLRGKVGSAMTITLLDGSTGKELNVSYRGDYTITKN